MMKHTSVLMLSAVVRVLCWGQKYHCTSAGFQPQNWKIHPGT